MFSGMERYASLAKTYNISMNENYLYLNHVTNEFKLTQMVYERFMLNIQVLQNIRIVSKRA
ncbi:hypothetical protein Hanom_Chr10g00888211 [Helianthus anomalus]